MASAIARAFAPLLSAFTTAHALHQRDETISAMRSPASVGL